MRSPKSAPPVFFFEGSIDMIPIVLSLKSSKKRRTNSSTNDDFPAPPVPVIPKTGVPFFKGSASLKSSLKFWGWFSAIEINRAMVVTFLSAKQFIRFFPFGRMSAGLSKSDF